MEFKDVIKYISICDNKTRLTQIFEMAKKKEKLLNDAWLFEKETEILLLGQVKSFNQEFIEEKIKVVEEDCELRLDEIYYEFQLWLKVKQGPSVKCPSRKDLKICMTKLHGDKVSPTNKNVWKNIAIINPSE